MTEGTKRDKDKLRWDLLPMKPIKGIVEVLTFGAKKYAPNNWMHVDDPLDRYYAACMRHLVAWRLNRSKPDKESGLSHLKHALTCMIFMLWFCEKEGE